MGARSRFTRLCLAASQVLALLTVACGDDESDPLAIPPTSRDDSGMGQADASTGPRRDAGATPPVRPNACELTDDNLYEVVSTPEPIGVAPVAVQAYGGTFGMAFVARGDACVDAVRIAALEGGRAVDGPQLSTALDDCSKVEAAALATAGDAFVLAAVDNREGTTDLWTQGATALPEPDAQAEDAGKPAGFRLTDNPEREARVALAGYGDDAAMVAWVARDTASGEETLRVRPLAANGKPAAKARTIESGNGWNFTRLSMTRIGDNMALAYHRFNAGGDSEVVLEVLDPDTGETNQSRQVVSEQAGPQPSVSVAGDEDGGGVLYSSTGGVNARQLWFLRLGADGRPEATISGSMMGAPAEPQRLVNSPRRAIDGSLAKLPTGFAVAYRSLAGGSVAAPEIELAFLERAGRLLGTSRIADAAESGSGTSLAFSIEGRLVLAWTDVDSDNNTHLRLARIPCVGGG